MTVSELISLLEDCDPDAQVLLLMQPNYPFEYSVSGVVAREDVDEEEEDQCRERGTRGNDVFILEGRQLRYGSGAAWGR